jgi:hypothetical protein
VRAIGDELAEAQVAHVARIEGGHDRALTRLAIRAERHVEQRCQRSVDALGERLEVDPVQVLAVGPKRLVA